MENVKILSFLIKITFRMKHKIRYEDEGSMRKVNLFDDNITY